MSGVRSEVRRGCVTTRDRAVLATSRTAPGRLAASIALALGAAVALVLAPVPVALPSAVVLLALVGLLHRHSLADLAAGTTLLVVRPYGAGERIRVYLDDVHEVIEAEVLHTGLLRTTLCTGSGVLAVPNSHLLRVSPS
jgi:small-conductance mechanosensitive channel